MKKHITGIIPAVFTPFHEDCSLNLYMIPRIVDFLLSGKVTALYVCGSNGEGPSLTSEERRATAEVYIKAAKGKLPVIIQVGHNSLREAQLLAAHAQETGADYISAVPPSFFKVDTLDLLITCLKEITSAAPELPFYYYHIPRLTAANFDMPEFLRLADEKLPTLIGIKYSNFTVFELQACVEFQDGKYNILFGSDEMLTSGLMGGARGAVGSTYNIAAPLYKRIIDTFEMGDLNKARKLQSLSVKMVRILNKYRAQPAFKATMKLLGVNCGPSRLPYLTLSKNEMNNLKLDLDEIGFFDWAQT